MQTHGCSGVTIAEFKLLHILHALHPRYLLMKTNPRNSSLGLVVQVIAAVLLTVASKFKDNSLNVDEKVSKAGRTTAVLHQPHF
jgi:uncharacterized membrane protein YwaF